MFMKSITKPEERTVPVQSPNANAGFCPMTPYKFLPTSDGTNTHNMSIG